jgi:hypothetical protein
MLSWAYCKRISDAKHIQFTPHFVFDIDYSL